MCCMSNNCLKFFAGNSQVFGAEKVQVLLEEIDGRDEVALVSGESG